VENNAKGKHIGWDIPWIYKIILNRKLTAVSSINLIKNIGYSIGLIITKTFFLP